MYTCGHFVSPRSRFSMRIFALLNTPATLQSHQGSQVTFYQPRRARLAKLVDGHLLLAITDGLRQRLFPAATCTFVNEGLCATVPEGASKWHRLRCLDQAYEFN